MNNLERINKGFTKGANNSYWGNISETVSTLWSGLMLTLKHLFNARKRWYPVGIKEGNYFDHEGLFTVRFPHETIPVPDNGRYKLHNEIDDCIVCDKCANICPVDCIEIDPIRSPSEFGKTSDGTPRKIYAARFDIDMAKCCFCGLCTTVCPTECLTMTDKFDFSEYDVKKHLFSFATLTSEEISQKRKEWEEYEKKQQVTTPSAPSSSNPVKPVLKPKIKIPGIQKKKENEDKAGNSDSPSSQNPETDPGINPKENTGERNNPSDS